MSLSISKISKSTEFPSTSSLLQKSHHKDNEFSQNKSIDSNLQFSIQNISIQPKLKISRPDDPYEREADRVTDLITREPIKPNTVKQEKTNSSILHRQKQEDSNPKSPPKPKSTKDKMLEGAKKTGEAFLETDLGKSIKDRAKKFVTSPAGGTLTGAGIVSTVTVLAIKNSALPMQLPALPLDFISPGLKAKITYEGPVRNPTKAMVQFTIPFESSTPSRKKPKMTKAENLRSRNAKMAQELEEFRQSMKSPEQKKADEEEFMETFWLMKSLEDKPSLIPGLSNPDYYSSSLIQPKLKNNQQNSLQELESEKISKQITDPTQISRKCKTCEMEEDELKIHRKSESFSDLQVSDKTASQINTSTGRPLDSFTKSFMESRFGYDFSNVRIHDDSQANGLSGQINARAFTFGNNVFLGSNESVNDKKLMAHELTHVIQQDTTKKEIQRDPENSLEQNKRSIRLAVKIFEANERWYKDEKVEITKADFDDSLNRWYGAIMSYDERIDSELNGDAQLKQELHDAYIGAIRILMSRTAKKFNKSESDLYHENNGRIPMWAWPTAHYLVDDISTPIEKGKSADPATGIVKYEINGLAVEILPDKYDSSFSGAKTELLPNLTTLSYNYDGNKKITSFTPPSLAPTIQTTYGATLRPSHTSGYGRGTTPEDIAGGKISPRSKSLGFHEGTHGLDFVEFLKNNPLPQFSGRTGMALNQFLSADKQYAQDIDRYFKRATTFTGRTECVGKTKDDYYSGNPKYVKECIP